MITRHVILACAYVVALCSGSSVAAREPAAPPDYLEGVWHAHEIDAQGHRSEITWRFGSDGRFTLIRDPGATVNGRYEVFRDQLCLTVGRRLIFCSYTLNPDRLVLYMTQRPLLKLAKNPPTI
jgi:hypothetical protein